ncbi:hypothetical protein D3869_13650 [Azospirillum brasilense]|uniref:Uncharacterized protein n=1 Tax=Azospirillum brasilense TaxID=192 RepID=A0A4D8R9M2_AZOBR|nr:hypothetical protein [Azospirillum brasilense]QCO16189.1 hypothetical protein D3869_13650 [Azospirillum brasilense]
MTVEALDTDARWSLRLSDPQAMAELRELAGVLAVLKGTTVGNVVYTAVLEHAGVHLGPVMVKEIIKAGGRPRQYPSASP